MVLVRNLKKTLTNSVSKILAELLSAFIRRRAKLILKKLDNSSSTESLQNPLTTEFQSSTIVTSSADTSEKTTMETTDVVMQARNWAITHIEEMAKNESVDQIYDRLAMMDEWYEWFDLDKMDGMDYIVLEDTTRSSESEI